MSNQVKIRKILLDEIEKEVFGPHKIDETFENTDHPKSRYLSGVLYPIQTPILEEDVKNASVQIKSPDGNNENEKIPISVGTKPSSMGLSCKISLTQKSIQVTVSYARYLLTDSNDVEKKKENDKNKEIKSDDKKNESEKTSIESKTVKQYPDWSRVNHEVGPFLIDLTKPEDKLELESNIFFRYFIHKNKNEESLTLNVFLTNEAKISGDKFIEDSNCIFQPKIKLTSLDSTKIFLNISEITEKKIKECSPRDQITLFLFRNFKHFAQGRNCAVEWNSNETDGKTDWVQTTFVPHYVVPEIKPREPSEKIKKSLNMKNLSEVTDYKKYENILHPITISYEDWIKGLEIKRGSWENDKSNVDFEKNFISNQGNIPKELTDDCRDVLKRIENGINKIANDPLIGESFRFANEVMYQNIAHSKWAKSNKEKISNGKTIVEENPNFESFEPEWRLFQLAFLLLNIESITNPTPENRANIDLLWFPTGGGKTEAYYGIIAFTLAYRRIKGRNPKSIEEELDPKSIEEELDRYGISIIMRYTYRLLTLQQFQRAATLFCACEYVRLKNSQNKEKFGSQPFLVGLWVGHDTTPNSFDEAKNLIQQKREHPNMIIEKTDPIQLLNCPWCGRDLNAFNYKFEQSFDSLEQLSPRRIYIRCDKKCFFGKLGDSDRVLPVVFVDEDIRNLCPSLLIATVDKFAQISWNWKYSTFFGNISQYCKEHGYRPGNTPLTNIKDRCNHPIKKKFSNGKTEKIPVVNIGRKLAPPELIIQDELHLIAGPLGTLTGIYETAIDILCTNNITGFRPKIIASTATTKKSDIQLKNLFNSKTTKIFPPQGFNFGESYFAEVLPISETHPGKLHIGICSTSVSGYNVDSRVAACILRKIRHIRENKDKFSFDGKLLSFTDEELDPYYTLVSYYNTIKNLGAAIRMYEDTIPSYMGVISKTSENKFQLENNAVKIDVEILKKCELTGRINAAEIPTIIQNIEAKLGDKKVLDVLLCTNMLSVGVDIERLNVMVINGQTKSTSEYIQASGRIGRKDPGIVITNYTYIRPRDLSYFENFIQFHSTYHKAVEPGTLTPFSSRSRDRGLAGVFVALIRMNSKTLSNNPKMFNYWNDESVKEFVNKIKKQILERVNEIDKSESVGTKEDIEELIKKWEAARTEYNNWTSKGTGDLKYRRNPFTNKTESDFIYLLNSSRDAYDEHAFVIPESLREAESEIELYYPKKFEDEE